MKALYFQSVASRAATGAMADRKCAIAHPADRSGGVEHAQIRARDQSDHSLKFRRA